jgi:hypothetical protein
MTGDLHLRDFTVPPRPGGRRAWRFTPPRFAAAVGAALLSHLPLNALLLLWATAAGDHWLPDPRALPALIAGAFLASLLVCGLGATRALVLRDAAIGAGLATGWVIGLIPAVVVLLSTLSPLPLA